MHGSHWLKEAVVGMVFTVAEGRSCWGALDCPNSMEIISQFFLLKSWIEIFSNKDGQLKLKREEYLFVKNGNNKTLILGDSQSQNFNGARLFAVEAKVEPRMVYLFLFY